MQKPNSTQFNATKKNDIIEVASKLFSQKGYRATTLKDISDRVGLHKTSIFHYFKNKEDILMHVIQISLDVYMRSLDDTAEFKTMSSEENLRLALEKQVSVICEYKDYLNVGLSEMRSLSDENIKKITKKRIEYRKHFEKVILEIQADQRSDLFNRLNPKIVNLGILGMCNWLTKWYREDGPLTPKDISDIFFCIITSRGQKVT